MPSTWSIEINAAEGGTVSFKPDVPFAEDNQPLGVDKGDNVTWNNQTDQTQTLQLISPAGVVLPGPIPAGQVSDPIFNVSQSAGTTIAYSCRGQEHSIMVRTSPAVVA
jgi:hypothetical protein